MKFAALRHKVGVEHGKNLANVGQGFLGHPPQHQCVAHTLDIHILRSVHKAQLLRNAHGQ